MKYTCLECKKEFKERDAYCENWRVSDKSFACPHCKTFFKRESKMLSKNSLRTGVISGGVLTPSAMMIGKYLEGGDVLFLVYGVFVCISAIVLLVLGRTPDEIKLRKIH